MKPKELSRKQGDIIVIYVDLQVRKGMVSNMYIIAGLGNPEKRYDGTRHNIGFDAVTALSDAWGIRLNQKEQKGLVGKGNFAGERVILVQPQTYMNLSGECIRGLCDYYKADVSQVIVICDDINLATGQLRIRAKGSSGGQNGLKNIIQHLGTEEFTRIRIGVGEKPKEWDLVDYVLGRFPEEEQPLMREALKEAVAACECIITKGCEKAMSQFNKKKEADEGKEKPKKNSWKKKRFTKKRHSRTLAIIRKMKERLKQQQEEDT